MPCYPSALQGVGGNCLRPVTLWTDKFELSFLSRFRATGDRHLRNTQNITFGCREKRNLDLERVCFVFHLQYLRGHGRQVQQKDVQMPHAMHACSEERLICHMSYVKDITSTIITAHVRPKLPKLTSFHTLFRKW